jgi:hypothetical protein
MALGFFDRRRSRDEIRGKKRGAARARRSEAKNASGSSRGEVVVVVEREEQKVENRVGDGDRFISMGLRLMEKRRAVKGGALPNAAIHR